MKIIFYSFILLFAAVCSWAQKTVNYVSFFPPAHIVHNQVSLTQDDDSFTYPSRDTSINYHHLKGGLILGAADQSITTISTITVTNETNANPPYAILNFNVDNIITVSSTGTIDYINIGYEYAEGEILADWETVFISASGINIPTSSEYQNIGDRSVFSSGLTSTVSPWNMARNITYPNFLPAMSSGEALKWVNLRIDGTEKCRKYLVKYSGAEPNWEELNLCNVPNP